jgi:hypothetical protein
MSKVSFSGVIAFVNTQFSHFQKKLDPKLIIIGAVGLVTLTSAIFIKINRHFWKGRTATRQNKGLSQPNPNRSPTPLPQTQENPRVESPSHQLRVVPHVPVSSVPIPENRRVSSKLTTPAPENRPRSLRNRLTQLMSSVSLEGDDMQQIKENVIALHNGLVEGRGVVPGTGPLAKSLNQVKVAANLISDPRFRDVKVYRNEPLDGLDSGQAILHFYKQLEKFAVEKGLQRELDAYLDEYALLYLSALLSNLTAVDSPLSRLVIEASAQLLENQMKALQSGQRSSFCWVGGSRTHFVPLRAERLESGNIRLSHFNLGRGVSRMPSEGELKASELKLGVATRDEGIVCTPDFLRRHRKNLCLHVTSSWAQNTDFYLQGIHYYAPKKEIQAQARTVIYAPQQPMGDCTCKGQWMLNQKAFRRLGLGDEAFQEFERQVLMDALRQLQEVAHRTEASQINHLTWIIEMAQENVAQKAIKRPSRRRPDRFAV